MAPSWPRQVAATATRAATPAPAMTSEASGEHGDAFPDKRLVAKPGDLCPADSKRLCCG
jgi:hypothetical protein